MFGPKFHKKFPRKRRPCSGGVCSCGGFPSTGGGRFDEGVDVLIAENAKVRRTYRVITIATSIYECTP